MQKIQIDNKLLKSIVSIIRRHSDPQRIILYGSRVTGKADYNSDIDIAVETKENISFIRPILEDEIPTLLKFDIVRMNTLDERLRQEIRKQGVVIYEKI